MNVAVFIVAVGNYFQYYDRLKKSLDKYFLPNHKKHYFVFTDSVADSGEDSTKIYTQPVPWPLLSLLRFHYMSQVSLEKFDLAYYIDVDQFVIDTIDEEVIPTKEQRLVGVNHARNFFKHLPEIYEKNPKSKAYVRLSNGMPYIHASFFGGWSDCFSEMVSTIKKYIELDLKNMIIPVWFDESFINRYFIDKPPKLLNCGYSYPDFWGGDLPVKKKIIHIIKDSDELHGFKPTYSKGLCMLAVGNPCFARYAYNLAASVKHVDKTAKICVFTYGACVKSLGEKSSIFDHVIEVNPEELFRNGKMTPNRFKLVAHKYSPFDASIFVDADSIWFSQFTLTQLIDDLTRNDIQLAVQCRKTSKISDDSLLYGCIDLKKCGNEIIPKTEKCYQLHGQLIFFQRNRPIAKRFFEESTRLFDLMADEKLSLDGWCQKWKWRGQAVEEIAMSIATVTAPTPLSAYVENYAPVATQDDDLKSIDTLSSRKVMISINGVENQKQVEEGGYICVNQETTERYIQFYNDIVDSINSSSSYGLFRWAPKVYEL